MLRSAVVLLLAGGSLVGCSDGGTRDGGADGSLDTSADAPTDTPRDVRPYVDPFVCPASPAALPLDEALDGTHARAGQITQARERIGGEASASQVGHYRIYNNRIRVVVQSGATPAGPMRPVGYDLYGGNVIDADRVRATGEPDQDVFREMFPIAGFRVNSVDEVSVVCDGANGQPAAIRVIGTDQPTRLITAIDAVARRRFVRIITHYVLRPDSDVIEIHTEVESTIGLAAGLNAGDFLAFGRGTIFFTTATGFGDPTRALEGVPFVAGASDPGEGDRHVSYAIAPAHGNVILPLADESGAFGQYNGISVPTEGAVEFVRYFAIGTGDVASVAGPIMRARGDAFGTIRGHTTPGALVYAYDAPYAFGATVRSFARSEADGAYSIPIAPGHYQVIAVDAGRARGAPVDVTVAANTDAVADPMAGPVATLVLDIAELTGTTRTRIPLKVSLRGIDVEPLDGALGDVAGEREAHGMHRVIYSLTGIERVTVKPGRYHAIVSRGIEYDTIEADVTVPADGEATLTADVQHVIDTPGSIAADLHQHTIGSVDSGRTLCNRVLEDSAEGLEFAATTDHDNNTDFAPCIASLGLGTRFNSIIGNEISVVGVGHFNAYPLRIDPADPFRGVGAQYWADLTTQQLFDRVRAETSDPILHVSHPRSSGLKGYFSHIGLDPIAWTSSTPVATGFEAIEVNESLGTPEEFLASADDAVRASVHADASSIPVLHDFFALLNRGEHTCALGNSDTHGRNDSSGYPHNLVNVGTDAPADVTGALVRAAIRDQHVTVTNGLVVAVRTQGGDHMGWRDVVNASGTSFDLEVDIRAAPWVQATRFAVFENGRPLALTDDGAGGYDARAASAGSSLTAPLSNAGVTRFHGAVHAHPLRDSYYVVVAYGESLAPVAGGTAYGYINPVYVDVDGGGWMPPSR